MFTDWAIYMEQGGRIDDLIPGTLAGRYANWLVVAWEERLLAGRRRGSMHTPGVQQMGFPPDA